MVEAKIRAWQAETGQSNWASFLPQIAMAMNKSIHSTLGCCPWEVVFLILNRKPPVWLPLSEARKESGVPCENGGLITEETLAAEGGEVPAEVPAEWPVEEQILSELNQGLSELFPDSHFFPEEPLVTNPGPLALDSGLNLWENDASEISSVVQRFEKSAVPLDQTISEPPTYEILAKYHEGNYALYPPGRPIATATGSIHTNSLQLHGKPIPNDCTLLFYKNRVDSGEGLIVGGELGYMDKEDDAENLALLYEGKPFIWPTKWIRIQNLTEFTRELSLPSDFQADLYPDVDLSIHGNLDVGSSKVTSDLPTSDLLQTVARNTLKAREKMVKKYSKSHQIEVFSPGDIVTVHLPKGTRTSTDTKSIWGEVIAQEHPHRYRIQTKWGVLKLLVPTKELNRVDNLVANSLDPSEYKGPSTSIHLSEAAKRASTSVRVVISCKCRGLCATKRCNCYKNVVSVQFIVTTIQNTIVDF